ncbi:O-antigen ligase family protein [Mucilaginibacter sp.]
MSGLFQIKDSLANKISYYHLMLLLASLPFDRFYSHLILISYCIHTLIHLKRGTVKPLFRWRIIALQSVFFITVLSTFYSINRHEGFNDWGKQITIFLFPIFFCLNPLDIKKYRPQLLLSFALVCTATVTYLYADALITIRHYQLPLSAIISSAFINHNFAEPIDMHATFFSMQLIISLIYLITILTKEKARYTRLFYLLCCIILTAGLIQLSSKSVLIVLLIIINIAIPYFTFQGAGRWKYVLFSASLSIVLISGILYSGTFRERFLNEFQIDLSKATINETSDGRLARWKVVTELIKKKPIIGYGTGSEMGLLQNAFYTHKLYNSYLSKLNAHNEYLSLLVKSGIIGFFIYAATLIWGFNISFKQKDLLFFTFILLIAIVSLSENVLDVDKGIFFYSFFFAFFSFSKELPVYSETTDAKHNLTTAQHFQTDFKLAYTASK